MIIVRFVIFRVTSEKSNFFCSFLCCFVAIALFSCTAVVRNFYSCFLQLYLNVHISKVFVCQGCCIDFEYVVDLTVQNVSSARWSWLLQMKVFCNLLFCCRNGRVLFGFYEAHSSSTSKMHIVMHWCLLINVSETVCTDFFIYVVCPVYVDLVFWHLFCHYDVANVWF